MNETTDPKSNEKPSEDGAGRIVFPKAELKRPWHTFISALAAGILMMLIWWNFTEPGLRLGLSVITIVVLLSINLIIQEKKFMISTIILVLLTFAAGMISVYRREFVTLSLSILVSLVGLFLLSVDFMNGQWWKYRIREYFKSVPISVIGFFAGLPVVLSQAIQHEKDHTTAHNQGKKLLSGILKGILIALPVLLIFTALFSVADSIFESKVISFTEWMRTELIAELAGRIFLTLLFTWLLSAVLWMAISNSSKKIDLGDDRPLIKPFLGMTETSIVLVSVNLLFAFFLIIQFRYFFAGEANINLAGFTYAEYARRGFMELLLVAAIAGALYYLLASVTRRETTAKRRLFSILGAILLIQVGVVLVSAYQRINLYVYAYGLTDIRLVPQIFIYFLAMILTALAVLEATRQMKRLALVLLVTLFLFSFTLSAVNIDESIARFNVERAVSGKDLDYQLLTNRLSDDAVPYLYEVLDSGTLPAKLQENLSKVMVCRSVIFENDHQRSTSSWLDWNYPTSRAEALHEAHLSLRGSFPMENIDTEIMAKGFQIEKVDLICDWN